MKNWRAIMAAEEAARIEAASGDADALVEGFTGAYRGAIKPARYSTPIQPSAADLDVYAKSIAGSADSAPGFLARLLGIK